MQFEAPLAYLMAEHGLRLLDAVGDGSSCQVRVRGDGAGCKWRALPADFPPSKTVSGIRVNCVAPGPVWTPLLPATPPEEKVEGFGEQVPMQRAAHPDEIAPSYAFFASDRLSSYYTGEVLVPSSPAGPDEATG